MAQHQPMLRRSRKHDGAVESLPVGLYSAAGSLLAAGVALPVLLGGELPAQSWAAVGATVAVGLSFLLIALGRHQRLRVVDNTLEIKRPLRRLALPLGGATLTIANEGTATRALYCLVLQGEGGGHQRLMMLGHGVSIAREIERATWVAEGLGLPLQIPPNLVEAARLQEAGPVSARQLPWIIGISVAVLGALGLGIWLIAPERAPGAVLRVECPALTPIEVNGTRYEKRGALQLGLRPGVYDVRIREVDGTWRRFQIPLESGERRTLRCDALRSGSEVDH
jgi:hypothetical protein